MFVETLKSDTLKRLINMDTGVSLEITVDYFTPTYRHYKVIIGIVGTNKDEHEKICTGDEREVSRVYDQIKDDWVGTKKILHFKLY